MVALKVYSNEHYLSFRIHVQVNTMDKHMRASTPHYDKSIFKVIKTVDTDFTTSFHFMAASSIKMIIHSPTSGFE